MAASCGDSADGAVSTTSDMATTREDVPAPGAAVSVEMVDTEADVDKPIAAVAAPEGDAIIIANAAVIVSLEDGKST